MLWIRPAHADGNAALAQCQTTLRILDAGEPTPGSANIKTASDANFCLGLVQGVVQTALIYEEAGSRMICIPGKGIKNEQGVRIFVRYLSDHPEQLHMNETVLLFIALQTAFPCDIPH